MNKAKDFNSVAKVGISRRNSSRTNISIRVSMSLDGFVASLRIWRISVKNGFMPSLQFFTMISNLYLSFEDFDQFMGVFLWRISAKKTEISLECSSETLEYPLLLARV